MSLTFTIKRIEQRISMAVAVYISGPHRTPGEETAFTENISARGARVMTLRSWKLNEILQFTSLPGDFRTGARVAYCEPQSEGFAIGLEFLEPSGRWVLNAPAGSGKPLHG